MLGRMTALDGEEPSVLVSRIPGTLALDLELVAAGMLTPAMRRLRFSGDRLAEINPFPGQDLMVAVPAEGHAHFRRRYTIRKLDRSAPEVVLDVVLHGHGPGGAWAGAIRPGDHVEAIGPRGKIGLAAGAGWHLFCGDESALPAALTMIEALPAGARAVAVLEVGGPEEEQEPEVPRCEATVHWLHRTGEPGTGTLLEDALAELALPAGHGHAYVFGEHRQVAACRTVLLGRGFEAADIDHKSYWRRGAENAANGEPLRRDGD